MLHPSTLKSATERFSKEIRPVSEWVNHCCCQIYSGCPVIKNFLKCERRYCCFFQFVDPYSFHLLNKVKRDINCMKTLYNEILADLETFKLYQNVNHFASNFDIFDPVCYIEKLHEERLPQLRDFLFLCRRIENCWYYSFFSISETFCISLRSFVFGYLVDYHLYLYH